MAQIGSCCVRYMDDWVVLVPSRWKLRAAIRAVNRVMAALRVRQHLDKTIIGWIAREFEFLGYRCSSAKLTVVRQTVERWERWVRAGLGLRVELGKISLIEMYDYKI